MKSNIAKRGYVPRPDEPPLTEAAPIGHNWRDHADCAGTDPESFFVEHGTYEDAVRRTCHDCPVRRSCLEDTLAHEAKTSHWIRYGYVGGMGPRARAALAQARREHEGAA